jgi:Signal transduction histidine kinase regulating C4-dicarboxylate transport system
LNLSVQSQQLVMIDRGQVEQVIINLLTNALDVLKQLNTSKSAKCIEVSIAQNANQQLYLEVSDNGTGISDHVIEMIFVPFFTTKQQGSGIGLSLSRQIMLNHGGDLVYIKRQQGACFRCVFG